MKSDVITVNSNEKVKAVVDKMASANVGAVLVVRDGSLAGIFSERDLLLHVIAEGRDPEATSIEEVSTQKPVSIKTDTPVKECARIMKDIHVRHVPVINEKNQPVGIVSSRDFFQEMALSLDKFIEKANYKNELEEGNDPYDHMGGGYDN